MGVARQGAQEGAARGFQAGGKWAQPGCGLALARRAAFSNDQWRFEGAPLLSVTTPAMGEFATDPSELATVVACPMEPLVKPIGEALRRFPRASFDYVWLIDPPPYDSRLTAGMTPVWRDGSSVVYRIR